MSTTEILLIRHAEIYWNLERRLQGHLEIPLNAEGQRQAQALGRHFEGVARDRIFFSDLPRAENRVAAGTMRWHRRDDR